MLLLDAGVEVFSSLWDMQWLQLIRMCFGAVSCVLEKESEGDDSDWRKFSQGSTLHVFLGVVSTSDASLTLNAA